MFSTTDTIVAIATPSGRGAIGVVRLAGPDAHRIACALSDRTTPFEPRHATLASVHADSLRDACVITHFPAPASYTGDDVVEVSAHGSDVVLRGIVSAACGQGARLAAPGEFTLRAFLNGKLSLAQAEAVGDLIEAVTPLQARVAFDQLNGTMTGAVTGVSDELFELVARLEASIDFPDEGYHFIEPGDVCARIDGLVARLDGLLAGADRGRLVREGLQVVLTGRPNAGKSSLFNALVGTHRAIVSDVPGTTRDVVSEVVDFGGLRVTLIDTAGLTASLDVVEREGVARAEQAVRVADVVVHVIDGAAADCARVEEEGGSIASGAARRIVVVSKSDLPRTWEWPGTLSVSAKTGAGIDGLVQAICASAGGGEAVSDAPMVSNLRHMRLLDRARASLREASAAVRAMGRDASEEFVIADLQSARAALEEVTGGRTPDDVLVHIFSRFCVGK